MDENITSPAPEAPKQTNKERLKEITDSIEAGIKDLFQSEKFKEYLRVMGKFHKYSFNNTMLIHMQRPDATRVAGFNKWKNEFNRTVKRGEHGITIIAPTFYKKKVEEMKLDPETKAPLVDQYGEVIMEEKEIKIPMYKAVKVFDVAQTVGDPLPQLASDLKGDVQQYEIFMEALKRSSPVPMEIKPLADHLDGYFSLKDQSITLREGMSEVQTVCAAVHEISHAKLHNKLADAGFMYQRGELFGRPVLFTKNKIDGDKLPLGLNCYDLRSMPDDRDTPALLEKKVLSNFAGTIITDMSLKMPEIGYINIRDELSITDSRVTLRDYYAEVLSEMANKNERTQEVEAESIAYAVCAYFDIETGDNSFGYIASWSSDKELKELRASLETINDTASTLISDINKNFDLICKERGIDRSAEIEPLPREALFQLADSTYIHVQRQATGVNFDYAFYDGKTMEYLDGGATRFREDDPLIDAPFIQIAEAVSNSLGIASDKLEMIDLAKLHEIEAANAAAPTVTVDAPAPAAALDEYPLPDKTISSDKLEAVGYTEGDLLPISQAKAHELLENGFSVYSVFDPGGTFMCMDGDDIDARSPDEVFAVLQEEWEDSPEFRSMVEDRLAHQEEREAAFMEHPDSFAIYQMEDTKEVAPLRFLGYDEMQQRGVTPERDMYNLIYTAELKDKSLDDIFYEFNMERPGDFGGYSLSTSDIVAVNHDGDISYHYVDRVGFQELPDFGADNPLKNAEMAVEDDYNMVDGIINNGEKQPTVAELEQQAKSGQPISLMDLADATHRESSARAESHDELKPKRTSIYEQLRQPLPQQPARDKSPKKRGGPEL